MLQGINCRLVMSVLHTLLLAAGCMLFSGQTIAKKLVLDDIRQSVNLSEYVEYLVDEEAEWRVEQLSQSALSEQFKPADGNTINGGMTRSVYWLRLNLMQMADEPGASVRWLLEMAYPLVDEMTVYLPSPKGGFTVHQQGDLQPFKLRDVQHPHLLLPLTLPAGVETPVYIRLVSGDSMQIPLMLWKPLAYIEHASAIAYVFGMIYGVLAVMFLYNLFLFISVRDLSYLYYILCIASFGLHQVAANGVGYAYLWPDWPWWQNISGPFLIGGTEVFAALFARSFLNTEQHAPTLDKMLKALAVAGAGVMLVSLFVDHFWAMWLAIAVALPHIPTMLTVGIRCAMSGNHSARYFVVAWFAFLAGGGIYMMMLLGLLPNNDFTNYSVQVGQTIEVTLLSLALADRINRLREEKIAFETHAREQLEEVNAALQESNRLKDDFLHTVTHELRTPMNGVMGMLDLMKVEDDPESMQELLGVASQSADEMLHIVNSILTLVELQSGQQTKQPSAFTVTDIVKPLADRYQPLCNEKSLQWRADVEDIGEIKLEGDHGKISQILECLLSNAIKFTEQGEIALEISLAEDESEAAKLNFEVRDTGIGMSSEVKDSIYKAFEQVDGSMSRRFGGLGLGLALAQALVEVLDGKLSHDSEPDKGTVFHLSIPVVRTVA
ncbi:sensor histidine kinase [Spongorhabdus nitratireducens]